MTEATVFVRNWRASAILLPGALLGGLLATAVLTVGMMREPQSNYAPIEPGSINQIEFLAVSGDEVRAAIQRVCTANGCDAGTLHPMITATAAAMTSIELTAALAAQSRMLAESERAYLRASEGSEDQKLAALEMTATARIADLYRQELSNR